MNKYSTNRYLDIIDAIVSRYNSRVNRTISLSPNDAFHDHNYSNAMKNLALHYTKALTKKKKPKYKMGDKVRIRTLTKGGGVFRKGYKPLSSAEIFTVHRVGTRLPVPGYCLINSRKGIIDGSFQAHALCIKGVT